MTTCVHLDGTLCRHYNKHNPPQAVCSSCEFKKEIADCGGLYTFDDEYCMRGDHPDYKFSWRKKKCEGCPWKEKSFRWPVWIIF